MIKKYTNKDYADKAIEANEKGEMLYIHTFEEEKEIETPEYETITEEYEIDVPDYETITDENGVETQVQTGTHKETKTQTINKITGYKKETVNEEVAELLIAPEGYYICYQDNMTDGTINENYEAEKAAKERKRLDGLTLTAADVERAVYKAKGMDFDDLIAYVSTIPDIDVKALKIELRANNFYRNHPYINQLGTLLGYTSDDLDYLFLHKELPTND